MNMNPTTVGVAAGVWALAAAALGWLNYSALSERQDAEDEFASANESINSLYESAIFPNDAAIDAVKTNEAMYVQWRTDALDRAARGDRSYEEVSGVQFKQTLIDRVGELRALPGAVDGKLCNPTFDWGFGKLLAENAQLPQRQETPRLLAQLDFVTAFAGDLADAGGAEVRTVVCKDPPPPPADAGKGKKPKKDAQPEAVGPMGPGPLEFEFEFLARPQALVRMLNGLVKDFRFVVITSFNFKPVSDTVMTKLAGGEKKDVEPRARKKRSRMAEEVAQEEEKRDVLIVDPENDVPLVVTLKLSVYDFGKGGER